MKQNEMKQNIVKCKWIIMNEVKKQKSEMAKTNKSRKWIRGVNKKWNGGIIDAGGSKLILERIFI